MFLRTKAVSRAARLTSSERQTAWTAGSKVALFFERCKQKIKHHGEALQHSIQGNSSLAAVTVGMDNSAVAWEAGPIRAARRPCRQEEVLWDGAAGIQVLPAGC